MISADTDRTHVADEDKQNGRTTLSAHALTRVAAAVTADAVGMRATQVKVDLSDLNGLVAIAVRAPARVPTLESIRADHSGIDRVGGLVSRAAMAQSTIRARFSELTGAKTAHVTLHLTSADIRNDGRVR